MQSRWADLPITPLSTPETSVTSSDASSECVTEDIYWEIADAALLTYPGSDARNMRRKLSDCTDEFSDDDRLELAQFITDGIVRDRTISQKWCQYMYANGLQEKELPLFVKYDMLQSFLEFCRQPWQPSPFCPKAWPTVYKFPIFLDHYYSDDLWQLAESITRTILSNPIAVEEDPFFTNAFAETGFVVFFRTANGREQAMVSSSITDAIISDRAVARKWCWFVALYGLTNLGLPKFVGIQALRMFISFFDSAEPWVAQLNYFSSIAAAAYMPVRARHSNNSWRVRRPRRLDMTSTFL